jgi:hypothetical protein
VIIMTGSSQVQDGPDDPLAHLPLAERVAARAAEIAELAATVASPGREPADYATAYGSLHEVVRAFLAGERNAKYLRRMHAEIESDLTGGADRG